MENYIRVGVKRNGLNLFWILSRNSSVGIATRYRLDGAGVGSQWGRRDFSYPSRPTEGPTQLSIQ